MNTNTKNLIQEEKLYKFKETLDKLTEKCLLKLTFEGEKNDGGREKINDNMFFIIESITKNNYLVDAFRKKVFKSVE